MPAKHKTDPRKFGNVWLQGLSATRKFYRHMIPFCWRDRQQWKLVEGMIVCEAFGSGGWLKNECPVTRANAWWKKLA